MCRSSRWRGVTFKKRSKYFCASGRRRILRKSMICMKSLVSPLLARRTHSVRRSSPGRKRSSLMRSNGPLATSRTPVASTTSAAGRPRANRSYQARTDGVTSPASDARHGTMAGTQVRDAKRTEPTLIGWNNCDCSASEESGQGASSGAYLIRSGGRHVAMGFIVGDHGRCLDFHQCALFDQCPHFHNRHGRKVLAQDFPVGGADFAHLANIGIAAQHVPGQSDQVPRLRMRFLAERARCCAALASLARSNCRCGIVPGRPSQPGRK